MITTVIIEALKRIHTLRREPIRRAAITAQES